MTNGLSHHYHMDESTFILRGFKSNFSFLFHFAIKFMSANRLAPDGMPRLAASHLGLFCLHMSHKKDTRLKWVKPVSHQPCGSRAPIHNDKFLGFVRQPHGVVNNTARLLYEKQGHKAAATNFRHVHFLCDLFVFSERHTTATRHTRLSQDSCKTRKLFVRLT